ncbi:MAG: heavy metal translocating P-type ATPase [Candidatus Paceibacterota bacterium]
MIKTYLNVDLVVALGIAFVLLSGLFFSPADKALWYTILYGTVIVGSLPLVFGIVSSLRRGVFGVDVIAIVAIIAALSTGETLAAGIVLLMLSGGESLERFAENRARSSLEKLLQRVPVVASLYKNGLFQTVSINEVKVRDVLGIKKGEVIPVDGTVYEGTSSVDESVITGEPIPRDIAVGDTVVSGTTNSGDFFTIEATATYDKSVFSGIVHLVEQAEKEKAPTVRLADKYSLYFTLFTFSIAGVAFLKDPHLATAVLVVATPCPLILAAPIAFIAGMSKSAKKGIIVKHGGVFEAILNVKAFFFDKTGTLTLGLPQVSLVKTHTESFSQNDVIKYAASLEQVSVHVFAQGIVSKAQAEKVVLFTPTSVTETTGEGISGTLEGRRFHIGKLSYLKTFGVSFSGEEIGKDDVKAKPTVYLAEEKTLLGSIVFSDTVRKHAKETLDEVRALQEGVDLVLITGDGEVRAREVGSSLGFVTIKANCLPKDKVDLIQAYEREGMPVAMIGDGVNDAPSLAAASLGVALGSHGATASTDIADAVIMVDDLERIVYLLKISKHTVRIAKQSMFFGMGLSVMAMTAALFGYLPPVEGAILQEGIDVLVILNALRAL